MQRLESSLDPATIHAEFAGDHAGALTLSLKAYDPTLQFGALHSDDQCCGIVTHDGRDGRLRQLGTA
jgi:hypothetical protein